tara:strand:+ start:508 stop:798 length:291 start_codon:yes stop_codon:yes gene_type:complete
MNHKDYFNEANESLASFGQFGLRILTTDAVADEAFVCVQALETSVISSDLVPYTTPKGDIIGDTSITALTLSKGCIIYGRFLGLQVSSGKIIAYKG